MEELASAFFAALLSILSVTTTPPSDGVWQTTVDWDQQDTSFRFRAQANTEQVCREETEFIRLPRVIHGIHEVFIDGKSIFRSGNPDFSIASPFYASPTLHCKDLRQGSIVEWQVTTYAQFFARTNSFPFQVDSAELDRYGVVIYIAGATSLLILCLFFLIVFGFKVGETYTGSVVLGSLGISVYFFMVLNSAIGIELSMLAAHKIADIGLWMGVSALFYPFVIKGHLKRSLYYAQCAVALLAILIIATSKSADGVQLGTTLPFLPIFLCQMNIILSVFSSLLQVQKTPWFDVSAITFFFLFSMNDILCIFGLLESELILPIGVLGCLSSIAFSVNQKINETYAERDELLATLEKKVEEKTQHLRAALSEKEAAQAELVQSAKLVSLGTLSAGIAHEINNSINFVSGAIAPLEKLIQLGNYGEKQQRQLQLLLKSIRDGAQLTVEIVKSLRNFTGLNQAKYNDVAVKEIVNSVVTILKSKLRDKYVVENQIPENLKIYGSTVGLNQVLMNLATNAMDAMPQGGTLTFSGEERGDQILFSVADSGHGMTKETIHRIYDPFFTTKDVGQGTGLGLYIVLKEIEKHQGHIDISSQPGEGTKFTISIPKDSSSLEEAA